VTSLGPASCGAGPGYLTILATEVLREEEVMVGSRARFGWSLALAAAVLVMLVPTAVARSRATRVYASAHLGLLYPVHAHAVRQAHAASATAASASPIRGARRIPRSSSTAKPLAAAPRTTAAQTLSAAAPSLPQNFNGVSSRDSAVTNFGAEFEPPDQGLCVGNGYVVEMVNSAYTVYRTDGSVVTGPFNVNGPFDEGLLEFTSDPRCMYDAATHTWFAAILFINGANTVSRVDLAVNTSGDPTKAWTTYQINTTGMGGATGRKHPGCPCFGDQPTLGFDSQNVYITTNEFSIVGPQFNGAQVYAIARSDLTNPGLPSTPAHFVHYDNLNIGGSVASSIQPAIMEGTDSQAEYFLNSLDPTGTFDQRLGVWAMTNRGAVAKGGKPTLSSTVLESEGLRHPAGRGAEGLEQPPGRRRRPHAAGAVQQRHVWGELDTQVTIPNDPEPRAGAAWFNVRPGLTNGVITSAHMQQQGYVSLAGNSVLYPALQVTPAGNAAMVMTLSGLSRFPSAAYSILRDGASAFGPIKVAAAGTTNYDPNATRWGDYSWAVLAPAATSVWVATEYVPPTASQTPDGRRNWGTRVFRVPTG
jgi:hypothetical protein